jgi:lipopolysaccharide transport system ATP-binding protein
MNVIELKDVDKRYRRRANGPRRIRRMTDWGAVGEHWALKGVTFSIRHGEAFGLVGRNGSGKSTTLRLMAGVTHPTRGSIAIARRVSGLLTLGEGFHPLLSAEENAVTQAILSGLTRRQALARLAQIAAFAELEEYMDQPLRTFSDGMRLRLGFAVAINVDPEVLLVDEVLAVGDLGFRQKCFDHLDHLRTTGVTVVLASHDLSQVKRMCTRAVWLEDGEVRSLGGADEVAEQYENAFRESLPRRRVGKLAEERIGSGEVEITHVSLFDDDGAEVTKLTSGKGVRIEIAYTVHDAVRDAIFGVSVHSEGDHSMWLDVSTASDGHSVGRLRDRGVVCLALDRLDLAEGPYWLDVGAYESNWERPYDYLWEVLAFDVSYPTARRDLKPPRSWTLR